MYIVVFKRVFLTLEIQMSHLPDECALLTTLDCGYNVTQSFFSVCLFSCPSDEPFFCLRVVLGLKWTSLLCLEETFSEPAAMSVHKLGSPRQSLCSNKTFWMEGEMSSRTRKKKCQVFESYRGLTTETPVSMIPK